MMNHMSSLDLAVIGNCMISALVDRRAQVVWSCFPRFDGDPIFSALLDSPEGRTDADQRGVRIVETAGQVGRQVHVRSVSEGGDAPVGGVARHV